MAQLLVLLVAADSPVGQWFVVAGYGIAALFALGARALVTTATAAALIAVRSLIILKIGGVALQAVSMVFADLFFVLVIFESEYYRTFRRRGRRAPEKEVER